MKYLPFITLTIWLLFLLALTFIHIWSYPESKPDPPPTKLKTIKVIDANKEVSYLSWECVTNE